MHCTCDLALKELRQKAVISTQCAICGTTYSRAKPAKSYRELLQYYENTMVLFDSLKLFQMYGAPAELLVRILINSRGHLDEHYQGKAN